MKSVLISIRPRWCELIAGGKKTVEVRKTRPKLETPFKVYIYCTMGKSYFARRHRGIDRAFGGGMVIGEFVCDKMFKMDADCDETFGNGYDSVWMWTGDNDCMSYFELDSYLQGKEGYGWHISDLVIYDKPKELGEFLTVKCTNKKASCRECKTKPDCIKWITRPPQSWCYVEEVKDK